MEILLLILAMLMSFLFLARIVDNYFVISLDRISKDLKMSSDAAGATLMAVGSSAPEFFVVLFSVIKPGDHQVIGIGSIVGSALFNLLVIVGVVAIVKKTVLVWQPVVRDIIFYIIAVGLLLWALYDGVFTITEAIVFISVYLIYVIAVVKWRKILPYADKTTPVEEDDQKTLLDKFSRPVDKLFAIVMPPARYYYGVFLMSIVIIAALSWILVETAIGISVILNIPEMIIGLTVLAVGTSVPDLFSSLIVARQGRGEMAVSNAIGSNIFDILIGLGIPFFTYMVLNGDVVKAEGNLLISSLMLFISVIVLLLLLLFTRWKVGPRTGLFLIAIYVVYVVSEIFLL